ncbi:MAG TPA: UDP-N-acetylmuramoyl-L-alanyl-D-glutamate--2,6-diaminopimelate ligase [Methylotenera sp.]|nr:UDP-N-acetylmuramoyl-L-alanyl-D-glutamate--2,6-diaminopimelate ligase [Methylotenera sp.]HPH05916.1 UDP-N-acetylmuramoyl-L-alanyl-D-glutamate--2,6-diaminopimelate ligase [Methylotenera sp.]HPN00697.1 UDP-N-acetylmuramoyl-L-alanyl-D-glutamate--2,6-diaminopimelate ligase [Methylotenera sp.]
MTVSLPLAQQFSSITSDSRNVEVGGLFLAYEGASADGRKYIPQAIAAGARGVFWDDEDFAWQDNWRVNNKPIKNLKQHVGELAAEFYGHPSEKLHVIGVTGTNGKTSVSQWIAQCLNFLGEKTAVLGTIGNGFFDSQTESANTTPDACLLQKMLSEYLNLGAKSVAMEVSSHGLEQGRVNGVVFEVAVLTNLSRDHLDYHKTMDAYAAAKQKLFTWDNLGIAILNVDDDFGKAIATKSKTKVVTYGLNAGDVLGQDLKLNDSGIVMQVSTPFGETCVTAPVLGRFNAYNVLAVLATLLALNVSLHNAVKSIANITPVRGRMQQFGGGEKPLVVVDYAHTPDALEKVLSTLRFQTQGKLICVFGCGGNRDAGKRPLMGQVAENFADYVVVTSDNPRNEDAASIIKAITEGMKTLPIVELDRAKAIMLAVQQAKKHDVVLVAGKGHEEYQEIAGAKLFFSDAFQVKAALEALV